MPAAIKWPRWERRVWLQELCSTKTQKEESLFSNINICLGGIIKLFDSKNRIIWKSPIFHCLQILFWNSFSRNNFPMRYNSESLEINVLRGEKLNYNSCTNLLLRKSQNLLFWLLKSSGHWKFTVFVRFTFSLNVSNHAHIWYVTWPQ